MPVVVISTARRESAIATSREDAVASASLRLAARVALLMPLGIPTHFEFREDALRSTDTAVSSRFLRLSTALVLSTIGLVGCQQKDTSILEQRISTLETRLDKVSKDLERVQKGHLDLAIRDMFERRVSLTPTEQTFETFRTQLGVTTFSVKNVGAYANGSKVTFELGNATNATLEDIELALSWGSVDGEGTRKELGKKSAKLMESFRAGAWTSFSIVLEQAKPDELGYIDITNVQIPRIKLLR